MAFGNGNGNGPGVQFRKEITLGGLIQILITVIGGTVAIVSFWFALKAQLENMNDRVIELNGQLNAMAARQEIQRVENNRNFERVWDAVREAQREITPRWRRQIEPDESPSR